ncbi:thiamine phosphate synthase [Hyphomicrobium sp.]|uniref:thiamine phosphate synthase n=1 Tax=Hyphomicrobium sp. TaxID=82 RepID=UPI001DDF7C4C|nr:thiamine phosphate synthase [Hyphomicrobium sp.]MBY0561703.1 thiamine phosphate synthase [Hyphomicrobium sp.]
MSSATSLYLDFEIDAGSPAAHAVSLLAAASGAATIASVLIRSADGTSVDEALARKLVAEAQKRNIAALVASSLEDATKLGADGIHLPWSRDIVRQFKTLKQSAPAGTIIGVDAGRSRHDAMEVAEAGADYVAFGVPPHVEDRERAAERQIDLIEWWNEVFEIPSVAFDVDDQDAAHRLAAAGADFVSVRLGPQDTEAAAAARIREFSEAIRTPEPAK